MQIPVGPRGGNMSSILIGITKLFSGITRAVNFAVNEGYADATTAPRAKDKLIFENESPDCVV